MRHRKKAINWIAIKSEPPHKALWAKLCLLVFIPGVLGSHGKFVSSSLQCMTRSNLQCVKLIMTGRECRVGGWGGKELRKEVWGHYPKAVGTRLSP